MVRVIAIDPISPGLWKITAVPAPSSLSNFAPPDPVKLPPLGPPVIDWSDGTPWDIYGRTPATSVNAYLKGWIWPIEANTLNSYTNTTLKLVPAAYVQIVLQYEGPNPSGEDIVFVVDNGSGALIDGEDSPVDASGEYAKGYAHIAYINVRITDYDSDLLGKMFSIYAHTSDSAYTTPSIIYTFTSSHSPMIVSPPSFWGRYVVSSPYSTTYGWTFPAYQSAAGDYFQVSISESPGYDWAGPTANITWTVTQIAGTTLPLTVTHNYWWRWNVTRSLSTDYSGTAYEIQFYTNSGADEFGPLITLTCES
jgi:hypothetical protein